MKSINWSLNRKRLKNKIKTSKRNLKVGAGFIMTITMVSALDFCFGGPRFKASTLLLTGIVLGCPGLNSLASLCIKPTVSPPASWDF